MSIKWLEWAKQMQSIAQAGLMYSKDVFDIERFQQLRDLSCEIISMYTKLDMEIVKDLFANEKGYQTPKVDIRAVIFQDQKILLVKEHSDGKWSLPGGWGDVGYSPSEVAVKEVREETGYNAVAEKLLAVLDNTRPYHHHPPSAYHVYKLFIKCKIVSGSPTSSIETDEIAFFEKDKLPPLSTARNTESQIHMLFEFLDNPNKEVVLD
ncbi:NUDIX hydrolase [Bacillus massiliigorillae]|uniref:NUDIX hydrolase n=1 Tax=Bacillus massiliigorillae TaxID=1243664 RepID=UPI0003A6E3D8|nr:NUDIX hydrolase [Bacillus massiliigorillae]